VLSLLPLTIHWLRNRRHNAGRHKAKVDA